MMHQHTLHTHLHPSTPTSAALMPPHGSPSTLEAPLAANFGCHATHVTPYKQLLPAGIVGASGLRPLYPHQVLALDGIKSALRAGNRRPMVSAPTGSGKTVLAAHIIAGARSKGNRVCFCVPSISLIDQTFARFVENGIDPADIGVIQADHPLRRPHAPVQIASVQTLSRRELPLTDVVVIDEAHVRFKLYERWMAHPDWAQKVFIGLSATPWSIGLGKHFDALVKPVSLRELIASGHLSPFKVFAPAHPDLSGVRTVAGDYDEGQLDGAMNRPKLVADVVSTWLERGNNEPTLCFAVSRAHAANLADQFTKSGVPCAYVDANTSRDERTITGCRLASGEIKVVCNIGVLTTGIDWDIRCIILARPTQSESLFVQIIGRGLRIAPGKVECKILDHSDTHLRLGMVTDIDHDELSNGKSPKPTPCEVKERKMALPYECTACACLVPAGVKECPGCGKVVKRPVNVEMVDGELCEIGAGAKGAKPGSAVEKLRLMGKERIWSQLKRVQHERAWSDGRTSHAYRDIFGIWPRGMDGKPATNPSHELLSFIRSKSIAFAKSKHRGEGSAYV